MRLLALVIFPLAVWCAPAVIVKDETIPDSLRPLIRTKRADEEILYGNHQNNAQFVKKSDPSVPLGNEEALIDKKATITVSTQKIGGSDVMDKNNDITGNNNDVNGNNNDVIADNNDVIDDITWGNNGNMEDKTEEEEGEQALSQGEEYPDMGGYQPLWKEDDVGGSGDIDWENQENYPDNFNYYEDFYPYNDIYRQKRSAKEKRSAPNQLLTAESMSAAQNNARVKRDLNVDNLYDWLEYGDRADGYPEYDVEDVEDPRDSLKDLAMAELLQDYLEPQQNVREVDYPLYEDNTVSDDGDINNKDLLSLLEYLVENEAPAEEVPTGGLYPEDVQEEWEDLTPQDIETAPDSLSYEPIVYEGVPGIFIPLEQPQAAVSKRQYMSMVPGVRKRNSFYPYSEEPAAHWGAFVPSQEEKRNAEAYERLYRMAQALNAPGDRYYSDEGYNKK